MAPHLILLISFILQVILLSEKSFLARLAIKPNLLIGLVLLVKSIVVIELYVQFSFIGYDLRGFYDHVQFIFRGLVPARDYHTPYSIGYEYLLALACSIYKSPLSIALLFLLCEAIFYVQVTSILVKRSRQYINASILIMATNPFFLFFTIYDTQDEILLILLIPVFLLLMDKQKYQIVFSLLSLAFTKVLALVVIVPIYKNNTIKGILLFCLTLLGYTALYYAGFYKIFSLEFSRPDGTKDIITDAGTSGNIWFLLRYALSVDITNKVSMILTLLLLVSFNCYMFFYYEVISRQRFYFHVLVYNLLIYLSVYKMTFAYYHWILYVAIMLYHLRFTIKFRYFKWIVMVYSVFTMLEGMTTYWILSNNVLARQGLGIAFIGYQLVLMLFSAYFFMVFFLEIVNNSLLRINITLITVTKGLLNKQLSARKKDSINS